MDRAPFTVEVLSGEGATLPMRLTRQFINQDKHVRGVLMRHPIYHSWRMKNYESNWRSGPTTRKSMESNCGNTSKNKSSAKAKIEAKQIATHRAPAIPAAHNEVTQRLEACWGADGATGTTKLSKSREPKLESSIISKHRGRADSR